MFFLRYCYPFLICFVFFSAVFFQEDDDQYAADDDISLFSVSVCRHLFLIHFGLTIQLAFFQDDCW